MVRKILCISTNRAEKGLISPIVTELKRRKDVEIKFSIITVDSLKDFNYALKKFQNVLFKFLPSIVLLPCDRFEIVYMAAIAFHHNFIISQLHAGNLGSGIGDEMNRRAISCFSHILLCNTQKDKVNLMRLGEEEFRCFVIGSTFLNHIVPDESLCPAFPYDLVLLHPDSLSKETTKNDLKETCNITHIFSEKRKIPIIWLRPNKDNNYEIIDRFLDSLLPISITSNMMIYENLSRPQFLGLLKNCKRFLGNSSSALYEFPILNPKAECIMIGHRNKNRQPLTKNEFQPNASAKIAELLATIPIDDKLRRKKLII